MTDALWSLSEQVALSFDGQASPAVALRGQAEDQPELLPSTWGLGWYPDNQRAATVIKDPDLAEGASLSGFLEKYGQVRSSLFVGQTLGFAQKGPQADAQPLMRSYAGRQWLLTSAGDISPEIKDQLPLDDDFFDIVPVGASAAEHAFSWIVAQIRTRGCRTIDEFGWRELHGLLERINGYGAASFLLTDGIDLVGYRDAGDSVPLYWSRRTPPHPSTLLEGRAFLIDYDGPMDVSRTLFVFSTLPMRGAEWTPMAPGELRIARRGSTVWSSHPAGIEEQNFRLLGAPHPPIQREPLPVHPTATQQQYVVAPTADALPAAPLAPFSSDSPAARVVATPTGPTKAGEDADFAPDRATLTVLHETSYRYSQPVERSSHRFCLYPVGDRRQQILDHTLDISVDGLHREYEDVFGNHARLLEVTHPFTEMTITSRMKVRVEGVVASQLKSPVGRDQIPLVWMPWQRQMMQAYLMPPELPEPELRELSEFAMSFVERNDYDLVETLLDLNRTIYRDFTYVPGSTTVETTPFQVYVNREGVCQDFANVLICVARLLSVPARYRVGYIYTGGSYENKMQSDASHAWAEVYLPWTGWFGFDPTNGCLAGADHVRIACGRQFRDAAPTTGTIYRGGGVETLGVDVRVERLDEGVAEGTP